MKSKIDKSLKEVWEWKHTLYYEINGLVDKERLDYIVNKAKATKESILKQII